MGAPLTALPSTAYRTSQECSGFVGAKCISFVPVYASYCEGNDQYNPRAAQVLQKTIYVGFLVVQPKYFVVWGPHLSAVLPEDEIEHFQS